MTHYAVLKNNRLVLKYFGKKTCYGLNVKVLKSKYLHSGCTNLVLLVMFYHIYYIHSVFF